MAVKTGTIKVANRVRTTTRVAIVARAMAFAGCCFLAVACSNGRDPSVARTHEAAPTVFATRAIDSHRGDTLALRKAIRDGIGSYRTRHYRAALAAFDRVVALRPNDVAARYDRGRSHEALHHWRAAEADLRYVASRRPAWSNARYALAIARFHRHHYAVAASDFDRVMRRGLRDGTVALDAGISYSKLHQWSTAVARFRTAVSDRPRSGRARYWLGVAYMHTGAKRFAKRELLLAARSRDRSVRLDARTALRQG